jgi:AcrR family transcriptional regulator
MGASAVMRRPGRREGASGTREAITRAARRRFGALGYDRTTIRVIASDAGVDPALVLHFFGSKAELFVTVMDLPFDPEAVLPGIVAGPRRTVGDRFARFIVGTLEDEQARNVVTGLVRAAASEPEAARMVRELISRRVVGPLAHGLRVENAELRATLVGSQIVGLVMARYVVGIEPLASLDPDRLVAALGPNLQRYLVGPLEGAREGSAGV